MLRSVLVTVGLAVLASAAAPSAYAKGAVSNLPQIETFTLANGLSVAVLHTDAAPVVAVQLWYHVGSKDEPRDRRGSAHMFEHMMFKGTQHVRAEAHAQSINGLGGFANATTDEDATHYIDTLPAEYMDYAVQLEAERMRNLLFRKPMIDVEREVVKEEIRRQDNSPITRGFLRFLQTAFTKHPYAWTAGGTIAELDATTPDDLQKFYDTYYQPNNALLVVVGKVTTEAVKASADKWFAPIAKGGEPPRPSKATPEPAQTAPRKDTADPSQVGLVLLGFHIPAARDKDIHAIQVTTLILGTGESSRLKLRLEHEDPKTKLKLSLQTGMEAILREDPGLAVVLGVFRDPAGAAPILAAITDEIDKLAKAGPTGAELRKAKNQVQAQFVFSLENAQGLAEAIGRSWIQTGNPSAFVDDVDQIEKVSAADVQRIAKTYFAADKSITVVIPPKAAP